MYVHGFGFLKGVFDMMGKTWSIYLGKPTESEPVAVLPLNF